MPDYYSLLGCSDNASPGELKRAYRKAALASHPDKNPDDPSAAARFREVHRAWLVLSDESQRAAYDARRRGASVRHDAGVNSFDDDYFRRYFPGSRRQYGERPPPRQQQQRGRRDEKATPRHTFARKLVVPTRKHKLHEGRQRKSWTSGRLTLWWLKYVGVH